MGEIAAAFWARLVIIETDKVASLAFHGRLPPGIAAACEVPYITYMNSISY